MEIKTQTLRSEHGHSTKKVNKLTHNIEHLQNLTSPNENPWYHECVRNSDTLLICAGDSWTWGNSIPSNRLQSIFGTRLAEKLDCDFINIGLCGESNLVVLDFTRQVIANLTRTYKEIKIVFTLTECTRDLVSLCGLKENYIQIAGPNWNNFETFNKEDLVKVEKEFPNQPIENLLRLHLNLQHCSTVESTILEIENTTVECIQKSFSKNINLYLGKNFCSWHNLQNATINKIWTEVIAERGQLDPYPSGILFLSSGMGSERLVEYQENFNRIQQFKNNLIEHIDNAQKAVDWLTYSPYNAPNQSKHPLEKGHEWWAEHLFRKFTVS